MVWRDSGRTVRPFACGTQPAGFPLRFAREITFDEEERPALFPVFPQPPDLTGALPAEANKVHVGGPSLPVPSSFGWLFLDLNAPGSVFPPVPPSAATLRQSWVETIMKAQGRYSAGFGATPLDSVCKPIQAEPGQ